MKEIIFVVLVYLCHVNAYLKQFGVIRGSTTLKIGENFEDKPQRPSIDVSDLALTLEDISKPLTELTAAVINQNSFSEWAETLDRVDINMRHPGMRGQPAGAVLVDFTPTTVTVSFFGYIVWSGILKGPIDPQQCSFRAVEGSDRIPAISLHLRKAFPERWEEDWIDCTGVDGVLQ